MTDYFGELERELRAAATRQAHVRWYRRLAAPRMRPLAVVLGCLIVSGSALAASGVIPLGSPVHVRGHRSPRVGSGVPAPGGSRLLALRFVDPAGGPPWGMRVVRTTRGLICMQIGRVEDGRLGELGIDHAFGDDGRFHPLPAADLPGSASGLGPGVGGLGENGACHLPGEAFSGDWVGIERSASGLLDTGHRPRSQLRDIYYGILGRSAVAVSYRSAGSVRSEPVEPGLGAYLIVLPTAPRDQIATGGGATGSAGGLSPMAPLSAISYRLRGARCERVLSGTPLHPCPPPQSLYRHGPLPTPPPLRRRLRVHLAISRSVVTAAVVSFTAPFAVSGAAQSYELQIPTGGCHGHGQGRSYVGISTDRNIAAGSRVAQSIGYPFANGCGRRTALIEVLYMSAGRPATQVGTITVVQPKGTTGRPQLRRRSRATSPAG